MRDTVSLDRLCVQQLQATLTDSAYRKPLDELCRAIGAECKCILVGGFLRDVLLTPLQHRTIVPRDIDIVILSGQLAVLNGSALSGTVSKTPLGGCRWWPASTPIHIDLWELERTVFFAELGIAPSVENLLDGFPFDVERAAYSIQDRTLTDRGAIRAISSNFMEHNPRWVQTARVPINAARAISIARHTGLTLGESIVDLIRGVDWTACRDAVRAFFQANGYTDSNVTEILTHATTIANGGIHAIPEH